MIGRSIVDAVEEFDGRGVGAVTHHRAVVRLALGQRERALDELERAAEARDPWIVFLDADDALGELHGEARFDRLVDRVHGRG